MADEYRTVPKKLASGVVKQYYYHKVTGRPIKGEPGTKAFAAALAEAGKMSKGYPDGSIGKLIEEYKRSPGYQRLSVGTRKHRDHALRSFEGSEHLMVRELRASHLVRMRDRHPGQPGKQTLFLAAASVILEHARTLEWVEGNVANLVERPDLDEHEAWPEEAVRAFFAAEMSDYIRTAFMLLLYTGQRVGDVVKMRWTSFDGEGIYVTQEKTKTPLWVPLVPELREYLRGLPKRGMTIVSKENGTPLSGKGVSDRIIAIAAGLGFGELVTHGLRKTACVRLAEAGCSPHEIMSISGHKSLAMVLKYTKAVDQKRLARGAMEKVVNNVVPLFQAERPTRVVSGNQ